MKINKDIKVALVCDWLTGIGGAELVVLELHKMFPNAPIYTSQYEPKKIDWFKDADVRTTWLDIIPSSLKKFLPVLRAYSFSKLNLSEYDLVISASGSEAKGIKTGNKTIHICYCHSPTHYYWVRYDSYLIDPGFGKFNWLARISLKMLVGPMRRWDFTAAQKPNYLLANSSYIKGNILKYYKRNSTIIYPPVDMVKFKDNLQKISRSGYVVVGRQTPYKKIDLAVKACTKLNLNLTVIGDGPENKNLKAIAGPTIKFLGQVDDSTKNNYLRSAEAFIFPGVDDFGIAAVEALSNGTPVIAYKDGGALDYINDHTGIFFSEQTTKSLCEALVSFKAGNFNNLEINEFPKKFSTENFQKNIYKFIESL